MVFRKLPLPAAPAALLLLAILFACTPAETTSPGPEPAGQVATDTPGPLPDRAGDEAGQITPTMPGALPLLTYDGAVTGPSRRPVELPGLWPLDLDDGRVVSINFEDQEVYLTDLSTGENTQISSDGVQKMWAALSGDIVAWITNEGQIELPAEEIISESAESHLFANHIVVYDLATGEQRRITREGVPRTQLDIDGRRMVWADKRNEMGAFYGDYDIYAYDLETDTEIEIAVAPGEQQSPTIDGDLVVWQDNRSNPELDGPRTGCHNCPDNRKDIYIYDFGTESSRPLVEDDWLKMTPVADGRRVVWIGFSGDKVGDLFVMDLDTGEIKRVTQTPDAESGPQLDRDRLLWTVRSDCDVIIIDETGQQVTFDNGVYLLDLESGDLQRLSDETEPRAFLSDGLATVTEGCMTGYESFVLEVDG